MKSLKGKVALVTGSTKGIGETILKTLVDEECNVIIHYYKDKIKALELKKQLNKKVKCLVIKADLRKHNEVKKMFSTIYKTFKRLDILVNNVGNYIKKDLDKLEINEWHEMLDSNLNATFYCTKYALPLMTKGHEGRIINIGYAGTGILKATPGILPYFISKTGILLLTKSFAKVESKNNIFINMVSPGIMENSIDYPKELMPIKRKGSLKGFANVIIQVIKSDYMTGSHIEYAGGFNL